MKVRFQRRAIAQAKHANEWWKSNRPAAPDYELAASFSNRSRASGVQGSSVELLICAVADRRGLGVLTTDGDFEHFAKILRLKLLTA